MDDPHAHGQLESLVNDQDDDIGAAWKEYRAAQQERRAARLPARTSEILHLKELGYRVRRLSDYQFRINEQLDLYPIHRRYHVLRTGKRGTYHTAGEIVGRLQIGA